MRIDFQNDGDFARSMCDRYNLVDLDTGAVIAETLPIFFADDETGEYRIYVAAANGNFRLDPRDPAELLSETRTGRIKFVPKIP